MRRTCNFSRRPRAGGAVRGASSTVNAEGIRDAIRDWVPRVPASGPRPVCADPRPPVRGPRFSGYVSRYAGRATRRLFYVVIKKRPVGYPQAKCLIFRLYRLPWSRVVIHSSRRYARCRTIGKKNPARGGVVELVRWLTSADKIPLVIAKNAPPHQLVTRWLQPAIGSAVDHYRPVFSFAYQIFAPVVDLVGFDVFQTLNTRPYDH